MKKMISEYFINLIVACAGIIILTQSITPFLHNNDSQIQSHSHTHSALLAITGLTLLAIAKFIRSTFARITRLEEEIKELKEKNNG